MTTSKTITQTDLANILGEVLPQAKTASTTEYGVTKLTDSFSSSSTDTAVTPNAVKGLRDIMLTYGKLTGLSSNLSLSTTAKKVPLSTFYGTNCQLSSNGIKVTNAGLYVVAGSVYFADGFNSLDVVHAYIYQNSTSIFEGQTRIGTANYYATVPVGPVIISLSAGDVIYLYAMNQGGARGTVASRTGNGLMLWRLS